MDWSLEKYLIADDCQLRLTLTGTLSITSAVVDVLRSKFLTGKLKECPCVNTTSLHDCVARIANIRRRSDFNIPVGSRFVLRRGAKSLSLPLDFVSIKGEDAHVFFVSKKKYKGTINQYNGYVCLAESIQTLYPQVQNVFMREILLLPLKRKNSKMILVNTPKFKVNMENKEESMESVFKGLQLKSKLQKDLRKCKIAADPCPAWHMCPAIKEKVNGINKSKQSKRKEQSV